MSLFRAGLSTDPAFKSRPSLSDGLDDTVNDNRIYNIQGTKSKR